MHTILHWRSGCCHTQVWRCGEGGWQLEESLPGHVDGIRDVAWAPNLGLPKTTVASAGQDGQVRVRGFASVLAYV